MQVTIDNITMQRITLDAEDVKNAIKYYIKSDIVQSSKPSLIIANFKDIDKAKVTINPAGGALVEIILDSVPDLPDIAPPCMEVPPNGITGPIYPDKIIEHLQKSFVPEPEQED